LHADWFRESHRRSFGGAPPRQTMAATVGDVSLGNCSRYIRGRPLQNLHVGLPLSAAAGAGPDDGAGRLPSATPATREPATPEGRVGSVDDGVGAVYRSARRSDSDQQVDQRADRGKWEMHGRGMRRRELVSRGKGGAF